MRLFTMLLALSTVLIGLHAQETEEEKEIKRKRLLRDLAEANRYTTDKEYEKAHEKFKEILKEHPDNMEAHLGVMNAYNAAKKTPEAIGHAEKTKSKTKTGSLSEMTLTGLAHIYKRDLKSAEASFKQAIDTFPEEAYLAHVYQGFMLMRKKKYPEAQAHLEKALELNEDYPETYYLLGDVYRAQKQSGKAIEAWNAYLERVPHEGNRYKWVVKVLKQLGAR